MSGPALHPDRLGVREIVTAHLTAHGYDGLYSAESGCACPLQDLFACDGEWSEVQGCQPCHFTTSLLAPERAMVLCSRVQ